MRNMSSFLIIGLLAFFNAGAAHALTKGTLSTKAIGCEVLKVSEKNFASACQSLYVDIYQEKEQTLLKFTWGDNDFSQDFILEPIDVSDDIAGRDIHFLRIFFSTCYPNEKCTLNSSDVETQAVRALRSCDISVTKYAFYRSISLNDGPMLKTSADGTGIICVSKSSLEIIFDNELYGSPQSATYITSDLNE